MPEQRATSPLFSLDKDIPGLVNARATFLELGDPTGWLWTQKYLNKDYDHWQVLIKTSWFKKAYEDWLLELKMALRVKALQVIKDIAFEVLPSPPATILAASRYLAEAGWEAKDAGPGRGRPSNAELTGELKRQASILSQEDLDLRRVKGLGIVDGGKSPSNQPTD